MTTNTIKPLCSIYDWSNIVTARTTRVLENGEVMGIFSPSEGEQFGIGIGLINSPINAIRYNGDAIGFY